MFQSLLQSARTCCDIVVILLKESIDQWQQNRALKAIKTQKRGQEVDRLGNPHDLHVFAELAQAVEESIHRSFWVPESVLLRSPQPFAPEPTDEPRFAETCKSCWFYSGNPSLRCAVRPSGFLGESCSDHQPLA